MSGGVFRRPSMSRSKGKTPLIVLGLVLFLIGFLLPVPLLGTIGAVLIIVGAVLWIAGSAGHPLGGRRWY